MFERYTEKARRVIFFARYEASQFGSPCIETEHLLLGLLREDKAFIASLEKKLEPACSGLVLDLGLDCQYPQLAHHNFFYSQNQRKHFDSVFRQQRIPDDPTIYLVAPTRTDPTKAPAGCDNIKILPHIPHLGSGATTEDYAALKERLLDKLERMGLTDRIFTLSAEDAAKELLAGSPYDQVKLFASTPQRYVEGWKPQTFATPSKKLEFYSEQVAKMGVSPLPDWQPDPIEVADAKKWPLRLLTAPGYFQAHTAFSGVSFLRDREGKPFCILHPDEARRRGLPDGGDVRLFNERGEVGLALKIDRKSVV